MASAVQLTVAGTVTGTKNAQTKSDTRGFKLNVMLFYRQNNLYQTSKKFDLNTIAKTMLQWAATEVVI